jgi:Ca2+-binding RTX toxin-like protein
MAEDSNDYILYNTTTGALLYDSDGNGVGAATQFATLTTKPSITAADFVVIA